MHKIILSKKHNQILKEHAKNKKPNESCAILFGKDNKVLEVYLTENIEESPTNFTISNTELINAYKDAEGKNLEVIGIFHSHPNSEAYPSNTDKKFMKINPVVWIIYSNLKDQFRAYHLDSEPIEIQIFEESLQD